MGSPRGPATLYVSPQGSDSHQGSSRTPLKTAQAAIDRLGSDGGTVIFYGGRYLGQRITIANRSHITLKAARGQTPVLDGKKITPPDGASGMIEISDSTDITDDNIHDSNDGIAAIGFKWATNGISVTDNTVNRSRYPVLAIGAYHIPVEGNSFRENNTLDDGSPEILFQYYVHDTAITDNVIVSTQPTEPLMLFRDAPAGNAAKNGGIVLNNNRYVGRVAPREEGYAWNGVTTQDLAAYQATSGQDASSTYTER